MLNIITTNSEIESDLFNTIASNSITALLSYSYNNGIVIYLINSTIGLV